MILLDEATNKVLLEEGQILVPLDAFTLTTLQLERVFENALREYADFCPYRKKETMYIPESGITLPDAQEVISVKIKVNTRLNRLTPFINWNEKSWDWNRNTKLLQTLFSTNFEVVYHAYYKFDYIDIYYIQQEVELNSPPIIFNLEHNFKHETIRFVINDEEFTFDSENNDIITLQSNKAGGSGTVNTVTYEVNLTPDSTSEGNLEVYYTTYFKGVNELSDNTKFFYEYYAAHLLTALANIKMDTKIEELPFDINADGLIDRARTIKDGLYEKAATEMYWFDVI